MSAYSEKVIERLWSHMAMIYGHRWSTQYGTSPPAAWRLGLAELSADEIKRGMDACVTTGDGWPPNLPEFRKLCLDTSAVVPACHRPAKPFAALPKPEKITAPGAARAHLAAIRAKITAGKPGLVAVEDVDHAETIARQVSVIWIKPSYEQITADDK